MNTKSSSLEYAFLHPVIISDREHIFFKGACWRKIFYHNYKNYEDFVDGNEALSSNTTTKYSIIKEPENRPKIQGFYEFLLYYPEVDLEKYNHWKQKKYPTNDPDAVGKVKADGYQPVHIDYPNYFIGLVKTTSATSIAQGGIVSCLLKGNAGGVGWWYAIGKYEKTISWDDNLIPGPLPKSVKEVFLYMKLYNFSRELIKNSLVTKWLLCPFFIISNKL